MISCSKGCWVSMPSWAWVVTLKKFAKDYMIPVSMPSWAWVVTSRKRKVMTDMMVSMPSWAWVVTARMSNILNFSWYFLCIPAIYKCILAYLPIFFNQLSKFLRCESPSTFLGTCLSHHSFIIFLVTNTNTLLSGLYLISIDLNSLYYEIPNMVSMPSRAYTSFLLFTWCEYFVVHPCQCPLGLIPHFYSKRIWKTVKE